MNTTLDGHALFDERDLQVGAGPVKRACVERSVSGLDGIASIDLGRRGRQLRQRGILRSASREALQRRIDAIAAFVDGGTHTLVTSDGRRYEGLRMDAFTLVKEQTVGAGAVAEYEIEYKQLGS